MDDLDDRGLTIVTYTEKDLPSYRPYAFATLLVVTAIVAIGWLVRHDSRVQDAQQARARVESCWESLPDERGRERELASAECRNLQQSIVNGHDR